MLLISKQTCSLESAIWELNLYEALQWGIFRGDGLNTCKERANIVRQNSWDLSEADYSAAQHAPQVEPGQRYVSFDQWEARFTVNVA